MANFQLQLIGQGRGCAFNYSYLAAIVLGGLLAAVKYAVAATTYTVGDSAGWNTGVNYAAWAQKYSFQQGDTFMFNYMPGLHSVNQVSQVDFQNCNLNSVLTSYNTGSDSVRLNAPSAYFICGTPGHCQQGMKVAIVTYSTNSTPYAPPYNNGGRSPYYGPYPSLAPPSLHCLPAALSILLSVAAAVAAFLM